MPHADSAFVPGGLDKAQFWEHVYEQLTALLDGQRSWVRLSACLPVQPFLTVCAYQRSLQVTNLANASSLIYNALLAYPPHFGDGDRAVNWCGEWPRQLPAFSKCPASRCLAQPAGFYLHASFFPRPRIAVPSGDAPTPQPDEVLLLGPFCGKPACQFINVAAGKARGVCADAFVRRATVRVQDVDAYPGHIACDGETKSEIVCPLVLHRPDGDVPIGVLDLDCLALSGFTQEDQAGLEKIATLIVGACDW